MADIPTYDLSFNPATMQDGTTEIVLKSDHQRIVGELVEALESYPEFPDECKHDESPVYCASCDWEHQKLFAIG